MICEECKKQGLKSRVDEGMAVCSPLGGGRTFWDEEGREHYHNRDITGTSYRCSNGHEWMVRHQHKCWCEETKTANVA